MSTIFDNAESLTVPVSERPVDKTEGGESKFKFENWFTPPTLNGKEIPEFKPQVGANKIDIIPFTLGSNLLAVVDPRKTQGQVAYDVTVDVHMKHQQGTITRNIVSRNNLGLEGDAFFAERNEQFKLANKDKTTTYWKKAISLFPKGRQLVLVMVYDEAGNRSLHYWAPSWHVFGELLKTKQENLAKMGENISYGHPTLGKSIFFTGYNKKFPLPNGGEGSYVAFDSIEVTARQKPYPEDIYTKMPSLDLLVKVPTAQEMEEYLYGTTIPTEAPKEETVQVAPPKAPVAETPKAEPVVTPTVTPEVTSEAPLNIDDFQF